MHHQATSQPTFVSLPSWGGQTSFLPSVTLLVGVTIWYGLLLLPLWWVLAAKAIKRWVMRVLFFSCNNFLLLLSFFLVCLRAFFSCRCLSTLFFLYVAMSLYWLLATIIWGKKVTVFFAIRYFIISVLKVLYLISRATMEEKSRKEDET